MAANPSTRVEHPGEPLGLSDERLLDMYRLVALARAVDERMWILNRAGLTPFVISGQGHEGAQVGITMALRPGHDWIAPYYRSIATCLTFGMTPAGPHARPVRQGDRPLLRRAADARPLRASAAPPPVGELARRDADPPRGGHRPGRQDPRDRPGRHDVHGRGQLEPGRRPRGPELRRDPPPPLRVSLSRTTATRSVSRARRSSRSPTSPHAPPATGCRAWSSTDRMCSAATPRPARRWTGPGPAADRP